MVDTTLGFVLGAIIGSIATAVGSYARNVKRERDATRRLRRALREELRAYGYADEMAGEGAYERLAERVEPPTIYAAAAGDLGRLREPEIDRLVSCYASIDWLRDLEDPEDKKSRLEDVAERRRQAVAALEEAASE